MSTLEISRLRKLFGRVLFIAALPLVFLGLIDPLEGGIALLLALVTLIAAFLLVGYRPRKSLWVPFVLAIAVGAAALLLAIFGLDRIDNQQPMIPLIVLLWLYRALVVATLVGLILEVVRVFKSSTFDGPKSAN